MKEVTTYEAARAELKAAWAKYDAAEAWAEQ